MANLADLVLLRNDPAVAEEFMQAAVKGDVDAQYGMGLIYAEGRGVQQDEAKAYFWLTRAVQQGDKGAAVLRKVVAAGMTPEQFARAELLVKEYSFAASTAARAERSRHRAGQAPTDMH